MLHYFQEQKKRIEPFLRQYIKDTCSELSLYGSGILDIPDRLFNFVRKGKMIRGGLVALSYSLYSDTRTVSGEIVKAGAVLELLQSGLLVHDDIMDRDETRRGDDSLFFKYVKCAQSHKLKNPYHIGEALGICAGDIFLFLAFHLLNKLKLEPAKQHDVVSLYTQEMIRVATAQMYDVFWGADNKIISASDIHNLYVNKTGRYTFSLPLRTGAIIAGAHKKECDALEKVGELLGIIFQIKDDDINLYGSEAITGKPVGSDIKEGKKTFYLSYLYEKADRDEKGRLVSLISNPDISEEDINYVKVLIEKHGIRSQIEKLIMEMNGKVYDILKTLQHANTDIFKIFMQLLEYNKQRDK